MNKFAFTCGDVNGIGPEIAIKALNKICNLNKSSRFVLIIPKNIFEITSKLIQPKFGYEIASKINSIKSTSSQVLIILTKSVRQTLGKPTSESGKAAFNALKISFELLKYSGFHAIVTAPVSKTALKLAGVKYPGQT